MKNPKNIVIVAIVAIVAIAGVSMYAISRNENGMMNSSTISNSLSEEGTKNSLLDKNSMDYKMYSQLTGDDYDRMFIANMIEHHRGAVDMAKLARVSAKHQELKDMADEIIAAQSKEIADMEIWQRQWDYPANNDEMMMDHSAMGVSHVMGQMTEQLKILRGDDFDKKFIELMIEHHQSAINMAASGATNAKHKEVKDLTTAIVSAQTSEILQMKQWQKDWDY